MRLLWRVWRGLERVMQAAYGVVVVAGVGSALGAGFLLAGLLSVRRIKLFAAVVTGVLVWFLVRSIPDSVGNLTAGVLRVVAPHLSGPLEAKQLELGLSVQGAEFVGAVLVLLAYALGMRQARAPLAQQTPRVIWTRLGALLVASFCWALWAPHFLAPPPAGTGAGIALSVTALGAAIGVLSQRNQLDPDSDRKLIGTCGGVALLGALLGQAPVPGLALMLAAFLSALSLVYLVGQLVELTTLDMRFAGHGGMLPATIAGFVVGLALGR